jgi:N-acetylated-alpha-linked acidic dipeptidase
LAAAKAKIGGNREALAALNAKLIQSERQFLAADGLKGRPWFKHMLYAPGYYTGYAVKTMPGVRENIEQKQYADADAEAAKLAAVLDKQAAWIDSASEVLEGMK